MGNDVFGWSAYSTDDEESDDGNTQYSDDEDDDERSFLTQESQIRSDLNRADIVRQLGLLAEVVAETVNRRPGFDAVLADVMYDYLTFARRTSHAAAA